MATNPSVPKGQAGNSVPARDAADGAQDARQTATSWFKRSCKEVIEPAIKKKKQSSKELLAGRDLKYEVGEDAVSTVFISRDNLWNSTPQVISYFFLEGNQIQQDKVAKAIVEWTWYANVTFTPAASADTSTLRIRFDPDDGSWSYVGRQNDRIDPKDTTMNLAWLDRHSPQLSTNEKAVILHEFGHALGLLHEHQSPAHGGVAVKNPEAALALYRKTQGWSDQQIYDQVINVYKMSDVSNFSQVDTHSIMHYPQPKELTGLPEDIPYNEKLSDLDKAYMLLQYPRPAIHAEAARQGWSFEKALDVIGAPKDVRDKVLKHLESDRDEFSREIDPSNIREIIETWCREAHRGPPATSPDARAPNADAPNGDQTHDAAPPAAPSEQGAPSSAVLPPAADVEESDSDPELEKALDAAETLDQASGDVDEGEDMCDTKVSKAPTTPGAPAHGITDLNEVIPLPKDGEQKAIVIPYAVWTYNETTGVKGNASAYHKDLVRRAAGAWNKYANVQFVQAAKNTHVDLGLQFNIRVKVEPEHATNRSFTISVAGDAKRLRQDDLTRTDWTKLDADIEYNGIFSKTKDALAYKSDRFSIDGVKIDGTQLNYRSVLHEMGHWLGLDHEEIGLYGYWMLKYPKTARDEALANRLWATRFDAGSIMCTIGTRMTDSALEVLKIKGLEPASVTKLVGQAVHRVNMTVHLSRYDKANIRLLYPGPSNLVDAGAKASFKLKKPLAGSKATSVLEQDLRDLRIYSDANFRQIKDALEAGKWQDARQAYLGILRAAQDAEHYSYKAYLEYFAGQLSWATTGVKGVLNVFWGSGPSHDISIPPPTVPPTTPTAPVESAPKPGAPISGPQHDAGGQPGTGGAPAVSDSFITQLYKTLSTLYCPGGNQYFALQFPTRFLDKQSYAYKLDGYFSRFNKPVVVNEAEFALSDALYPTAAIVGGPNGQTLSSNYSKALNSLIPTFESVEVRKQREKMRKWLLTETKSGNSAYTLDTRIDIPGLSEQTAKELSDSTGLAIAPSAVSSTTDQNAAKQMALQAIAGVRNSSRADPRGMTRIEFADSLMQEYLNERKAWELQRDDMIRQATDSITTDPQAIEKLTRRLAHITAIEEAKLASKYADAVIRGYSHTVRGFMGHLDIKSVAESLQDAKDSLRESGLSSLYTASTVYPVAMLPADWFEALDTGFTREDLSQDPELIKAAVKGKSQLIDSLETQIGNLRGFNKGDPTEAKKRMDAAAAKREQAMATLSQKYTASTISAVKLAIAAAEASTPAGTAITAASRGIAAIGGLPDTDPNKKSIKDLLGSDSKTWSDIGQQMDDVASANMAVNAASRDLTEQMSEYATAVAGDTQGMIEALQRQITTAKADLAELQESYTIAQRATNQQPTQPESLDNVGKLPQGNGGSRWSEVHIKSSVSNEYTSTDSTSSSSVSTSSCNFWIGSYSSSSSQSQASNQAATLGSKFDIDVAMRVTYVTVDRSGWFDPSFFDMSKSFMRGAKDEDYSAWSAWKPGQTAETVVQAIKDNSPNKPQGYLTAFPVGYVLVKDCVIRISTSTTDIKSFKSHFDQQAESSGGFLCFSHSSGSRSSSDSSASSTAEAQGGLVVRIPGPQILGYIMQLVGPDNSQPFKEMSAEDMFIEGEDSAAAPKPGAPPAAPAHDIGPNRPPPPAAAPPVASIPAAPTRQAGVRKYDEDFSDAPSKANPVPTVPVPAPAHGIQESSTGTGSAPGKLVDAVRMALEDGDVVKWLQAQPQGTKDELLHKLTSMIS